MESLKKYKTIIVGITLLFVGFFVYNQFFKEKEETGLKDIQVAGEDKQTMAMINILEKAKKIDLNPKFFNEVSDGKGYLLTFSELKDFKIDKNEKLPGKVNPFLLGGKINYVNPVENENTETEKIEVREEIVDNPEAAAVETQ